MKPAYVLVCALALAACQTPREPVIRTVEVKVPVAVPCRPNVSPEPDWTPYDAALKGPADQMLQGAYAGYKLARAYIKEQAAGLKGCAGP